MLTTKLKEVKEFRERMELLELRFTDRVPSPSPGQLDTPAAA